MSKNCPNCMHTVRSGVNYCGYCGASLVPTPKNPAPTEKPFKKFTEEPDLISPPKLPSKPKRAVDDRSWVKIPIIMLVLVIVLAMAVRFWPEIMIFLSQTFAAVKL